MESKAKSFVYKEMKKDIMWLKGTAKKHKQRDHVEKDDVVPLERLLTSIARLMPPEKKIEGTSVQREKQRQELDGKVDGLIKDLIKGKKVSAWVSIHNIERKFSRFVVYGHLITRNGKRYPNNVLQTRHGSGGLYTEKSTIHFEIAASQIRNPEDIDSGDRIECIGTLNYQDIEELNIFFHLPFVPNRRGDFTLYDVQVRHQPNGLENEDANAQADDDVIQLNDDDEDLSSTRKNLLERIIEKDEAAFDFLSTFEGTSTQKEKHLLKTWKQILPMVRGREFAGQVIVEDVSGQGRSAAVKGTLHIFGHEFPIRGLKLSTTVRSEELKNGSVLSVKGRLRFSKSSNQKLPLYRMTINRLFLNYNISRVSLKKR